MVFCASSCIPCFGSDLSEAYCWETGFRFEDRCSPHDESYTSCLPNASKLSFVCFLALNFVIFCISFYGLIRKQGIYQPLE